MIMFAGDVRRDFVPLIEEASEATVVVLPGDQEPLENHGVDHRPGRCSVSKTENPKEDDLETLCFGWRLTRINFSVRIQQYRPPCLTS